MYTIQNPPITPRENFIRAAKRQNPLWLPMKSDTINFCPRIWPDNIARAFVLDGKPWDGPMGGKDVFGINWRYIPTAGGSMVDESEPLMEDFSEWREKVVFPDIDSWDWEASAKENEEHLKTDKFVEAWIFTGFFERLISFTNFETAAVALIDEDQEDDVRSLLQALTDYYKILIDHFVKYHHVDAIYLHDDWGGQRGPLISLGTIREMIVPYMKQVVDHCHSHGILFDLHCCGKNETLVPAMLEAGVDIWGGQPLNDKKYLVDTYGDQLLIGIHTPYGPGKPVPESDEELYASLEAFLEPYRDTIKERPFFLMDIRPDPRVREAYFQITSKLLAE